MKKPSSSSSAEDSLKRLHVIISGRVQGVFFRAETQRAARSRSLKGWVRNTSDGMVEAVFEGSRGDVDSMLEWCRHGPPAARVTRVETIGEIYAGEFDDFRIRY